MNRVVLAELKALKTVDHERLGGKASGLLLLLEQQAVSPDPLGLASDTGRRNSELTGNLAIGGAAEQPVKDRHLQFGTLQPVAGVEGL